MQMKIPFAMGVGVGGTFDVAAGKVKRAPVWMQKTSLEWFYRTSKNRAACSCATSLKTWRFLDCC